MENLRLKVLAVVLLLVGFVGLLGVVGDYDWSEQVVLHMSRAQYDWVKDTLKKMGVGEPSERDIAHWWAEHHGEMSGQ